MEFSNYIGGEWVPGAGGAVFETRNPANQEVVAKIAAADVTT